MSPLIPRILFASAMVIRAASAATPIPVWYGGQGTVHHTFLFNTSSATPSSNVAEPAPAVVATIATGAISSGWQNPSEPFATGGLEADGAWDLGIGGTITATIPASLEPLPPGSFYRIQFLVYAVAYRSSGFIAPPTFQTVGLASNDLTLQQATLYTDPSFPGTTWEGLAWSGHVDNPDNGNVTFRLTTPGSTIAVVDRFEIFTRIEVIPEPSTSLLVATPVLAALVRRRRS